MANKTQHTQPPIIGTVHESYGCGCRLDGVGNLQDPWRVVRCPMHEAAPEMLAALRHIAWRPLGASTATHAEALDTATEIARAAITKATGVQP